MHKSSFFALDQMKRKGCSGVCVQKLGEALALFEKGCYNIFISNEIISQSKLERVAELAQKCTLAIAVDSVIGIENLAKAMEGKAKPINVFVDVNIG